MNLQQTIDDLFLSQRNEWKLLDTAIKQLDNVKVKDFEWSGGARVEVQFNPARMVSTSAKIDKETIEKRPCFLCPNNRPKEQKEKISKNIHEFQRKFIRIHFFGLVHKIELIFNKIPFVIDAKQRAVCIGGESKTES